MDFRIGSSIIGKNCSYRIIEKLSHRCYSAIIVLSGDLGELDSDTKFLLVSDESVSKLFQQKYHTNIIEILPIASERALVIPDNKENRAIVNRVLSNPTKSELFSANKYEGQMRNGIPHGKGTMHYGDGKKYTGDFVNGLRHGHGTLTMPNGESFTGLFHNDSITDNGTYYDEHGQPCDVSKNTISLGQTIWNKSWRLFAAIACFGAAILIGWLIIEFFTSKSGGHMRVGAMIAPFVFCFWGIKFLIGFFSHLFKTN